MKIRTSVIIHLSSVICHQEEVGNDELDELTPDELKSLLDNFPTLSKQEKRLAFDKSIL
jgi:hypothetical protein